jgi:membrane protein involved in colicin uptake
VRKGFLEEANDLLKSAKRLLAKASEDMEDTADEEGCEKALSTLRALTKAVAKADEDDKKRDEEEAAEKARVAKSEEETKKKIEEAKKDGEKEKQAEKEAAEAADKARQAAEAAAKSNAVSQEQILKALEGLTVLPTTVQGLIDAVMGKSQNPGGAPEITKGQVLEVDFAKRVDQAIDENRLSDEGITRAMSLVQHMHLAKAGRIDMKVVEQEIDKSPAEVRDLFRQAA